MKKVMLLLGAAALAPTLARAAEPPDQLDAKTVKQPRGGVKIEALTVKQKVTENPVGGRAAIKQSRSASEAQKAKASEFVIKGNARNIKLNKAAQKIDPRTGKPDPGMSLKFQKVQPE